MPTTPLLFVDNLFDTYNLYTLATVSAVSEVVGREAFHVADYRRDRTWWQSLTVATDRFVLVDHGVGVTRTVDYLYIDRGHNLWGKTVRLRGDDGAGGSISDLLLTVPAVGTVGGDPTLATMSVTEEGALYSIFAARPARRRWIVYCVESWQPIITGILAGTRTQLLGYSTIFDEDAGERTPPGETSAAGYRGSGLLYSWRTCELGLKYIGAAEYDATMRTLRRLLFDRAQPFVLFMDYQTNPERGWMYQYEGTTWGMAKTRVYREGRLRARELGAAVP